MRQLVNFEVIDEGRRRWGPVAGPVLDATVPKRNKARQKQQRIEKDDDSGHVTKRRVSGHPIWDFSVSPIISS